MLRGGTLNFIPNASANSVETISSLNMDGGGAVINLNASASFSSQMTITTLGAAHAYGTVRLSGPKLGQAAGGTVANINVTTLGAYGTQPNGANGTTTMAIRPDWVAVDTTSTNPAAFVVRDSANGFLRPLAANEYTTFTSGMGTAGNTNQNILVSGTQTQLMGTWINSLTMEAGSTINMAVGATNQAYIANTGAAPTYAVTYQSTNQNNGGASLSTLNMLNIITGGLVVRPGTGTATISGGILDPFHVNTWAPLWIHADGDLNLDTFIQDNNSLVKAGSGTVTISRQQWNYGGVAVNAGTLALAGNGGLSSVWAGSNANTLRVNPGTGWWTGVEMVVNGGTLDLNGRNQLVNRVWNYNNSTNQSQPGIGGVITSATPATLTVANNNGGDHMFTGDITGPVSVVRAGTNWWNIGSPLTYTGSTKILGATQLVDKGALVNTSSLDINYAEFRISENNFYTTGLDSSSRLPANLPITMRGSTFRFYNAANLTSAITLDTVTLAEGQNYIDPAVSSGGQVDVTINSLVRANDLVTVSLDVSNDGTRERIFLNSIDPGTGVAVDPMSMMTNGIIGGWALTSNDRFATYIPGIGISGLAYNNTVGQSAVDLTQAGPTDNLSWGSAAIPSVTTRTINSMRLTGDNTSINMASATDRLTILSGGFIQVNNNNAFNVGQLSASPNLAGTSSKLYMANNGAFYINGTIVDNGASGPEGALTLVKLAGGNLFLTGSNSYTGGTVVNQGTLTLGAVTPGVVTLPKATNSVLPGGADLQIHGGAAVTMANFSGQIASGAKVNMIGNATFNLIGANTLGDLNFNDNGGVANATLSVGLGGRLTLTGNITANVDNPYGVPEIRQGVLDLNGRNTLITVTGSALGGMNISSSIYNGSIQKEGAGVLSLNGPNQFNGGIALNAGTLNIGSNGALGTGEVVTQDGTAIIASSGVRIANKITVHGTFALSGNVGFYVDGPISTTDPTATLLVDGTCPYPTFYVGQVTGPMTVQKVGTSPMRFNMGGSDYTGDTLIQGGSAVVNMSYATSPNSRIVLYPGTVFDLFGQTTSVASILDGPASAGLPFGQIVGTGTLITGLDNTSTTYSGTIVGGSNIMKVGTGTWTLAGQNYHTGTTFVNQGTLQLTAPQGISPLTTIQIANANGGVATLQLDGSQFNTRKQILFGGANGGPTSKAVIDLNGGTFYDDYSSALTGANNNNVDMIWYNASGNPLAAEIVNGTLKMASGDSVARYQAFRVEDSGSVPASESELVISANLQSGPTMTGIIKWGQGAMTLSGNNTYVGYTRVDGGTLRIATANSLPSTSQIYMNTPLATNTTNGYQNTVLDMSAVTTGMTVPSITSTITGVGSVLNNAIILPGGGLTLGGDNSSTTYAGILSGGPAAGTNALTKVGSGVFTLAAPNPWGYTGDTFINGAAGSALKMNVPNALPFGTALTIARPATAWTSTIRPPRSAPWPGLVRLSTRPTP